MANTKVQLSYEFDTDLQADQTLFKRLDIKNRTFYVSQLGFYIPLCFTHSPFPLWFDLKKTESYLSFL